MMRRLLAVCFAPAVLGFGSFGVEQSWPMAADAEFYCDDATTISEGDDLVEDGGGTVMGSHEWCGNANECKAYRYPSAQGDCLGVFRQQRRKQRLLRWRRRHAGTRV